MAFAAALAATSNAVVSEDDMIMAVHRRLSSYADGGSDAACWRGKLMVECAEGLPGVTLDIAWNSSGESLIRDVPFSAASVLDWPADMNVTIMEHGYEVDHANFHACLLSSGFCSPFVAVQPGLVTHAPAVKSHTGMITLEASLDVGMWTLIAHFRMYVDGGVRIDIAKGIQVEVKGVVPEEEFHHLTGLRALGYSLLAINLGMAGFFAGWVALHRRAKVVVNSQPCFLYIVALGCTISSCTIIPLGFDDGNASQAAADAACAAVPWLYSIGFCLIFSALFAKILRVKRIFLNPSMKSVKSRPIDVLKPMLAIMAIDIVLLAAWTASDPLKYLRTRDATDYDMYGYPLRSHGMCSSPNAWDFVAPLLALHVMLLLYANYTAYLTRNVKSDYQEAKWVALTMVSQFQILVLAIPVLIMVADDPITSYFLRVGVIFLNDAGVLLLIFVPKLKRFYQQQGSEVSPYAATMEGRTVSGATSATSAGIDVQAELDEALGEISKLKQEVLTLKAQQKNDANDQVKRVEKTPEVQSLSSPR